MTSTQLQDIAALLQGYLNGEPLTGTARYMAAELKEKCLDEIEEEMIQEEQEYGKSPFCVCGGDFRLPG